MCSMVVTRFSLVSTQLLHFSSPCGAGAHRRISGSFRSTRPISDNFHVTKLLGLSTLRGSKFWTERNFPRPALEKHIESQIREGCSSTFPFDTTLKTRVSGSRQDADPFLEDSKAVCSHSYVASGLFDGNNCLAEVVHGTHEAVNSSDGVVSGWSNQFDL